MFDACWSLWRSNFATLLRDCVTLKTNKQINNSNPARQKSSWADCYHQAGAERSHWYGVIEGFLPLGRITGLEMIARFNRPLKPKGNTSAKRKRALCPSHWPATALQQTFEPSSWIGHVCVSLSKKPYNPTHQTYCLFILHLNLQNLSI